MPLYDYICNKCKAVFEIEKRMTEPDPKKCPNCKSKKIERYFGDPEACPAVTYKDRPPWTYKECLKYKDCKFNDGPRVKIDPRKHGDIGAWHCPGEVLPPNSKDKADARKTREKKR